MLLEPLRTLFAAAAGEEAALGEEAAVSAAAGVHPSLQPRLDALVDVLRAAGVSRATLFGSAARPHGEAPHDVDVVVRLGGPARGRAARYFALAGPARSSGPPACRWTSSRSKRWTTPTSATKSPGRG